MEPNTTFTPQVEQPQPTQQQPAQPMQPVQPVPIKKDNRILVKVLSGLFILVLVAGGVGAYLWRDAQANRQKTDDAAKIKTLDDKIAAIEAITGPITQNVLDNLKESKPFLTKQNNDVQRQNDLSRLNTALASYESNNRGAIPSGMGVAATTWTSFVNRYVKVDGNSTFTDPSGTEYIISDTAALPTTFNASNPVILITTDATCNGQSLTTGQGSRKAAFQMRLENGSIACENN
jgi:flagellar basal body-associated protein FliL